MTRQVPLAGRYCVEVRNSGSVDADDAVLGFISAPGAGTAGAPIRELFGFERVHVAAGQTVRVWLSPSLMAWSKSTWPIIGITYVAAGVAHFTFHDGFVSMMPHRGAWGFWNLPGSASYHVNWTGVAEILGGAGLLLGSLTFGLTPNGFERLTPVSAACLFALTLAVTPANAYMFTHNAPGPLPPDADESALTIPPAGHFARFLLQVFLLSLLHGCIDR